MKVLQVPSITSRSLLAITATAQIPKIIIDTDFNTIGDDGQVLVMAAQLHASKELELLGVTTVIGNQYQDQCLSDCLKGMERLGIENQVGVYAGAEQPFLHTYSAYQLEQCLFGNATEYVGAYESPESSQLVSPPDGFAAHTVPQRQRAAEYIIKTVHRYPREVNILAIGPLTNVALAMKEDPTIIPLIKQIVIMGGQVYVPGNTYLGSAETNWWFDPESTRVVLRAAVPRKLITLDVTNTVLISNETYDKIGNYQPATPITTLFKDIKRFPYVYDTVALASLVYPDIDLDTRELYIDVNCDDSAEYGKGLVWDKDPYPREDVMNSSSVVFAINNTRFFDLYIDLLTLPVPVRALNSSTAS